MGTTLLIAITLVIAVFLVLLAYLIIRWRFENRFRKWQESELQLWQVEKERVQREAIAQSRAVLGGKFTEQLAPYLPEFKYDATEARFIGSPIDLIVFPGLASGNPQEIVIMEIKSGKSRQLSSQQRKIRQLIEDGMVRWELIEKTFEE